MSCRRRSLRRPTSGPGHRWQSGASRPPTSTASSGSYQPLVLHSGGAGGGAAHRMWTDLEGWFEIDAANRSVTVPPCSDPVRREERFWGVPVSLCYLLRGDVGIHAAAVEVEGAGVLLAAPGRSGKTTLAGAFLAAGHRLLSEDLSCCRSSPVPLLLPGPAMLRVRRDVHE